MVRKGFMPTVVARETFPYAGITRRKGTRFEASEEDARILGLAKKADPVEDSTTPAVLDDETALVEPRVKRTYRRRDLTVETPTE